MLRLIGLSQVFYSLFLRLPNYVSGNIPHMFKFFTALSENKTLHNQIQLLETEKQQFTDKIKALTKELNQTRETLGKTQIRHAQELQRYADVEIRMQKARKAYKELRIQQQENEVEIQKDKESIAELKAQLDQANTKQQQTEDNPLTEQLENKEQEIQALDQELKSLQEKYLKVSKKNETLKQDIQRLQEKTKKAPQQKQKRVLIIDDSITTRTLMKKILESAKYEVYLAKDGVEGQSIIEKTPLDIIVTDAEMPNMDGFELTRWVKNKSKTPEIPIIMIASMTDKDFQAKAEEAGASSFITKNNFHQQVFLNIIESTLNPS